MDQLFEVIPMLAAWCAGIWVGYGIGYDRAEHLAAKTRKSERLALIAEAAEQRT